jgi:hypothetical protein
MLLNKISVIQEDTKEKIKIRHCPMINFFRVFKFCWEYIWTADCNMLLPTLQKIMNTFSGVSHSLTAQPSSARSCHNTMVPPAHSVNVGTLDIVDPATLCCGRLSWEPRMLSLTPTHQIPEAPPQVVTSKSICRCFQMSPGRQNHSNWEHWSHSYLGCF